MDASSENKPLHIALVGQPNTGKSTIFNRLTGLNQHVGNWPGKTVEKKQGFFSLNGVRGQVTDLPGTYSLTANSLEEKIARDFLIHGNADVAVVIVDASQLERSLYMLAETLLLPVRVVVALNMIDVAQKTGTPVDAALLEKAVMVPVIPMVASKGEGIERLKETVSRVAQGDGQSPDRGPDMEAVFGNAFRLMKKNIHDAVPPPYTESWMALKLIEMDSDAAAIMKSKLSPQVWESIESLVAQNGDAVAKGSAARYEWINGVLSAAAPSAALASDPKPRWSFDRAATHPVWGKFIAGVVLLLTIIATYITCLPPMLLGLGLLLLPIPLRNVLAGVVPDWLVSMLCDGIMTGLGVATCVAAFIFGVFMVLGFLEDVGYLARLSYVFDRFMNKLGLHGKSFIPLGMGFVCNIMAVTGTRVIDGWRQRLITLLLAPLIPCKGLLVVVSFISIAFFGINAIFVFLALAAVMTLQLVLTSFFLRRTLVKGEDFGMIMELPPYHKPNFKTIRAYAITRTKAFFRHGYWIIVIAAFLTWAGVYFPDGQIDTSYLARVGRAVEPFGMIMGMDWRLFLTFLVCFSSKEATLGAMAVIYGASSSSRTAIEGLYMDQSLLADIQNHFGSFLVNSGISDASALAFLFAVFFSLPCLGTLGTIYSETGSYKWAFGSLAYYLLTSIIMGAAAYQVGLIIFR